jgi:hypothetical protein
MTSNDRDGTNVQRTTEETGQPTIREEKHFPSERGIDSSAAGQGRVIEDVSDQKDGDDEVVQRERDRQYEERMEDEYAKREGGA